MLVIVMLIKRKTCKVKSLYGACFSHFSNVSLTLNTVVIGNVTHVNNGCC